MRRLTLAFVGQCQTVGYPGVPPDAVFPQICRRLVQARRPETLVDVDVREYQHPWELPEKTASVLEHHPRVVVIEAVGWLAIKGTEAIDLSRLPRGVKTAVQRVRHLRHVGSRLTLELPAGERIYTAQLDAIRWGANILRKIVPRYPRPTIEQYGQSLEEALQQIAAVPGTDAVVQGPAAPNLELDMRGLAPDAIERYRAVAAMARRVAETHGALYVDRWDTTAPGFFLPGSIRPSAKGHTMWGNLLAERLLAAGVV